MLDCSLDGYTIPLAADILKQPPANKEKTWQTEQKEHIVPPHPLVTQAVIADMRIDHENHRKSSHRIDVFYPAICYKHLLLKRRFIFRNITIIE